MNTSSRVHPSCVGLFLAVLILAACGSEDEVPTDPYGLRTRIHDDRPAQRNWVEPDFRKVVSLSSGSGYTLYNPVSVEICDDGHLYVLDAADYRVKAFNREGRYIATYGKGRGMAPGQVLTLTDVGLWRDSLIYIVDPRQQRVSFFEKEGDLVRSENYDFSFYRLAWTSGPTKYMKPPAGRVSFFMKISTPDSQISISRRPITDVESILTAGVLHENRGKAIYVPRYLPILISYSPDDTVGTAYPTPDYGRPLPKPERKGGNTYAPSTEINQWSTAQGGVLSVQRPTPETDSLEFDLYDLSEIKYMHSIRLPVGGGKSTYGYETGVVASVRDTTVDIYEVQHPQK